MEKASYDPYIRLLPSNIMPERTPFTRAGRLDAGHLFIYNTNKWKRWSLLLDKAHKDCIYEEALHFIPRGIFQLWLVEKRYSTHLERGALLDTGPQRNTRANQSHQLAPPDLQTSDGRPLVVLREPARDHTLQGDVLSYHLEETDAIAAAETYTRRHHHRALVGMVLWDEIWIRH
jgi:hypothetical protein